MSRAAYMREYRAKKRLSVPLPEGFTGSPNEVIAIGAGRILALEEEVARLKRELAARPTVVNPFSDPPQITRPDPYRTFTPAPKPGRK